MSDADPPLYPPTLEPAGQPLGTLPFLARCVRNPLATIPAAAYREPSAQIVFNGARTVWLSDPDALERVLVADAAAFRKTEIETRLFAPVIGHGVLTSEGSDWRWQRRLLAPLFRPSEILSYVPDMAAAADSQIGRWRDAAAQSDTAGADHSGSSTHTALTHAIDDDMTLATYDVIVRTMLFGGAPADVDSVMDAGQRYLSGTPWTLAYGMLRLPAWLPHPATLRLRRSAKAFRKGVEAIISDRRRQGGATNDLLGRLLAARDPETDAPLTQALLVDNLATLLEAGHETTAKALTWALYLLARAPSWQQTIRDEVHAVCGDAPIEAGHVARLAITERVVKETLRLYPPAPVMSRTPITNIEIAGHELAPGDQIIIPVYAIHRHHSLWDDPGRFDPDRFLPERESKLKRTQFMPFGAGPRICLGASFALVEAKVLLASFVRAARFDWDGRHLPEPLSRVTLHPSGGMPLAVTML